MTNLIENIIANTDGNSVADFFEEGNRLWFETEAKAVNYVVFAGGTQEDFSRALRAALNEMGESLTEVSRFEPFPVLNELWLFGGKYGDVVLFPELKSTV